MPSTHFKELDIQYDTNKLIEESKKVVWKPFKSKQQAGTFFDYAPTWLQGRVFGPHIDINDFPEIRKICNLIKFKIKTDDGEKTYKFGVFGTGGWLEDIQDAVEDIKNQ